MEMNHQKKRKILVFILLFVLMIGLGLLLHIHSVNDEVLKAEAIETEESGGSIAVPGFEGLSLKADTKKQNFAFENPSQNNCYFVISLILEDGTMLWESDYIKPGKISKPVKLNTELRTGTYPNATLKYSCYRLKNKKPMDKVETKLTLWVK